MTSEPSVFLSYSSRDAAAAAVLEQRLEDAGIHVWRDVKSIEPGGRFRGAIADGVHSSDAVIVLISRHSSASEEVLAELELAREERRAIMPAYLEPLDQKLPGQLRALLAGTQAIELHRDFDAGADRLARALLARGFGPRERLPATHPDLVRLGTDGVARLADRLEDEIRAGKWSDARTLVVLGQCQLYLRRYPEALATLRRAVQQDDRSPAALHSLALAMVAGRRPRALTSRDAQRIGRLLDRAAQLEQRAGHHDCLAAIVKADFYEGHGLSVPPPSIDELRARARSKDLDQGEVDRITTTVDVDERTWTRAIGP